MSHQFRPGERVSRYIDPETETHFTNHERREQLEADIVALDDAYAVAIRRTYPAVPRWTVDLREFQRELEAELDDRKRLPTGYFDCHCGECR